MEQSYFQIQLDRAIKEAERLVKTLYAVKTAYADKRMEEAVPIEIGFTEEGWFCLRMPILLPRKEKSSRS